MSISPTSSPRSGSPVKDVINTINPSANSTTGTTVTNAKVTATVFDKLSTIAQGTLVQPFLTGTASVKQNFPFPTITNSTAATRAQTPPPPVTSNTISSTGLAWHEKLMETAHSTVVQPFLSGTAFMKQNTPAFSTIANNTISSTKSSMSISGNVETTPSDKVLSAYMKALNKHTKALNNNTAALQQNYINTMSYFPDNRAACVTFTGKGHGHHLIGTDSTNSSHENLSDLDEDVTSVIGSSVKVTRARKERSDGTFPGLGNKLPLKEGFLQARIKNDGSVGMDKVSTTSLSTTSSDDSINNSTPLTSLMNNDSNSTNTVPGHVIENKVATPSISKSSSNENLHKTDVTTSNSASVHKED